MVTYICNPGTEELEAGESQVGGQPWLHNKPVSKKKLVIVAVSLYVYGWEQ